MVTLRSAAAAAHAAASAVADAAGPLRPHHRRAGDEAGREARAPRALSGALRDPRALAQVRRRCASPPPAIRSGVDRVAARAPDDRANLIRVFFLQERLKALGKDADFKARHVHVVGAGTMGGDIAAWCALRGLTVTLQDQAPERLAPAMKRAAEALHASACRTRGACAMRSTGSFPTSPATASRAADVIIEAIFENLEAKRALFAELEAMRQARRDPRDQHLEPSARGHRQRADGSRRASSACTSSTRCRG